MAQDDNPPAFPNTGNSTWNLQPTDGMNLRDWFAGQALTNPAICDGIAPDWQITAWFGKYASGIVKAEIIAKQAGAYADAMLAERNKVTPA